MPCYTPDPTPDEIANWRKRAAENGDWKAWYRYTPQKSIEQWLCDALSGREPHSDTLRWWHIHQLLEKKT